MVAAIVLGLARGLKLPDAVRFGMAAGAAALLTPGTELCRREDVERLYAQISRGGMNEGVVVRTGFARRDKP
jgi:6-phosphofructokinase 2